MSLFVNPSQNLRNAINWFNSLNKEEQVSILSNLEDNPEILTDEQNKQLTIIALEIGGALIYGQDLIVNKFIELGLTKVHANLIVNAIGTKHVLPKLDAKKLLLLNDDQYKKAIDSIIIKLYVENNNIDTILKDSGLNQQVLEDSFRFIRDNILFSYLRGDLFIDNLKKLLESINFPNKRIEILINTLEQNKDIIWKNFLFRNTADTNIKIQVLEKNQIQLINEIQQLIQALKYNKKGDSNQEQKPSYYA
jgi:hypothetical protein